ncbi:MAG: hypothetical protein WA950_10690 [Shinella sp.]
MSGIEILDEDEGFAPARWHGVEKGATSIEPAGRCSYCDSARDRAARNPVEPGWRA